MRVIQNIALFLTCLGLLFSSQSYASQTEPVTAQNATEAADTKPLEAVSLQLKWLHQFQFAGYYAAKLKGFYEAEGLDVTIKERDLFKNNIEQVIKGESEYGISDSTLMLYQAQGSPLSIVSAIFQHSPHVFLSLKSSKIESPYDLQGKNIAFYQKDTDGFPLLAMLHQNNIEVNTNRMVIKAGPEVLEKGAVDVYPAYVSNEPYYFYSKGIDINIIRPMNFGVDLYGDLIFTHKEEVKNHPERVEAFKRASIKGWQYALKHKEEIIDYIINELKVDKTFDHLMYEALAIEEVIQSDTVPIGTLNPGRLTYIQKMFEDHKLIQPNQILSDGIYQQEQHKIKLNRREKAWIKQNPRVKVAVDRHWQPIEFVNSKGEYDGLLKNYLDYIGSITGIEFIPQIETNWTEAVEAVRYGQYDMFAAVVETPDRRKFTNFTPAFLNFPMVLATLKGENYIADFYKLPTKTIAVVENYAAHEIVKTNYPQLDILLVESAKEGLEAVSNGLAYGYLDNLAVIGHYIGELGLTNLQISGKSDFNANIKMAVNKELPQLHSILTKALATIDEPTRARFNSSWLTIEYKQEIDWRDLTLYLSPAVLILILILIYGHKMRRLNRALAQSNDELVLAQQNLEASHQRLEVLSVTDFLTGAYNRQHLDLVIEQEINRCIRYGDKLSILLIDLDDFKKINDTYGHIVGDQVLKDAFNKMQVEVRRSDTVGRWGGEEFLVICPQTQLEQAVKTAEKILSSLKKLKFNEGFTISASIGISEYQPEEESMHFVERADKQLYRAKEQGKDQACA